MAPVSSMNSDSNEKRAHALLNAVDFRAFDSLLSYKRSYPSICWKHQAGRASERLLSDASGLVCAWLAASQALYDGLHTHIHTVPWRALWAWCLWSCTAGWCRSALLDSWVHSADLSSWSQTAACLTGGGQEDKRSLHQERHTREDA